MPNKFLPNILTQEFTLFDWDMLRKVSQLSIENVSYDNFLAQGSSFTKDILCGNSKMKVAAPVFPLI